jgi:crossover junction endodeoxyribonuclease RuvC
LRVLGIDPGTLNMGAGVVDSYSLDVEHVHSTVISPARRDGVPARLHFLFREVSDIIERWEPTEVAIEQPFAGRNVRAAMAIGHAQAVAMVAAAGNGLPVFTYTPRQVKQAVTDYGGSSKEQVADMVRLLLGGDLPGAGQDATDALAVAICHVNASHVRELTVID